MYYERTFDHFIDFFGVLSCIGEFINTVIKNLEGKGKGIQSGVYFFRSDAYLLF
jgi:hypothetical protein